MLLPPEPQTLAPRYRATTQEQEIFAPNTRAVIEAYAVESLTGIGTYKADIFASDVKDAEKAGTRITKEQFDQSSFLRPGMEYYPEMTEKSMELIAKFHDEHATRQELIARASIGQHAIGMTAGILTGTLEPKNLAIGIATAGALGPILGAAAPIASQAKKIVNLRRANSAIAARAGYGATEGLVAAAIAEPSNRYSAKTLQQDYTMMDTFFNIATSSVLGGAIGAVSPVVEARFKREPNKVKAYDTTLMEHDTAINQLAIGQKVDVSHVERVMTGEIATKPIAEKAATVEQFVKYTETPEFKARFEGSKVVDAEGKPLMVYHGTSGEFSDFKPNRADYLKGIYSTRNPNLASNYAIERGDGANVRPMYVNIKNPLDLESKATKDDIIRIFGKSQANIKFANKYNGTEWKYFLNSDNLPFTHLSKVDVESKLIKSGFDGAIYKHTGGNDAYIAFSPDQIISAFGADDMDAIAKRLDAENTQSVSKAVTDSLNPENDTAIDYAAARALDEYNATLSEDDAAVKASYEKYLEEIAFMRKEGLMTDAEIEMFTDAINSVNEKDLQSGYDALLACLTRG